MKLRDILTSKASNLWFVKDKQTVQEAVSILVEHKIGALLVLNEKDQVVGIISERDIMRECLHHAKQLDQVGVKETMTKRIIICNPDDDVDYVMGIMTKNRIRHVPVFADGKLAGIVSIGDVVKAQLHRAEYEVKYLKEFIAGR